MSKLSIKTIINDWKGEQKYVPINHEAVENGLIKSGVDNLKGDGETYVAVPILRIGDKIEIEIDGESQVGNITAVDEMKHTVFFPELLKSLPFSFFGKFAWPTNRKANYQVIKRLTKGEEAELVKAGINIRWESQNPDDL